MSFDIETIKRKMLVKYPFFGSVVANVDYRADKNLKTAGTNGRVIYYNPEFLEKLSVEEQIFIFTHEVCHIAFNHILRSKDKKPLIWNIATDAVINAFLKRDGLKIIEGGIDMANAINYDAEQLYEKLLQEKQYQKRNGQDESISSSNTQSQKNQSSVNNEQILNKEKYDVGHDTHSMWDDMIKKCNEDELCNKDKIVEKSEIENKQEETSQLGEQEAFKKNLEEKKKELEELKKTLSRQIMGNDSLTNNHIRNMTDIGSTKPLIDWRYLLKEATKYDVDWSYRNATIENGVISANLEEQVMPETEILLDTSGSINETLLKNFLRECKNILQYSKIKIGCFDTKFYGFHEIRTEEDIENMKFVGGGGTNFNVAVGAFSTRAENKIIFTDGAANMPDMALDAIWIVFDRRRVNSRRRRINPKGGKVIQINNYQLDKLYSYQQGGTHKGRR